MNAAGTLLIVTGIWVLFQVLGGGALEKTRVVS